DDAGTGSQWQRGKKPDYQLVGAAAQGIVAGGIVQQPGKALTNAVGLGKGAFPLVIDQLGGVEPGLLLSLETAIRPRLVRMPGEQDARTHFEPGIVGRQGIRSSIELRRRDHRLTARYGSPTNPETPVGRAWWRGIPRRCCPRSLA